MQKKKNYRLTETKSPTLSAISGRSFYVLFLAIENRSTKFNLHIFGSQRVFFVCVSSWFYFMSRCSCCHQYQNHFTDTRIKKINIYVRLRVDRKKRTPQQWRQTNSTKVYKRTLKSKNNSLNCLLDLVCMP